MLPAERYDVPSVRRVNDPDNPASKFTAPVNVEPDIVATIESSIPNVTVSVADTVVSIPDPPVNVTVLPSSIVSDVPVSAARLNDDIVPAPAVDVIVTVFPVADVEIGPAPTKSIL